MLQEWLYKPWPWYIVGPLMGATIPMLLFFMSSHKMIFIGTLAGVFSYAIVRDHLPH